MTASYQKRTDEINYMESRLNCMISRYMESRKKFLSAMTPEQKKRHALKETKILNNMLSGQ